MALSRLYCFNNQLTSIPDLSNNMALERLRCETNELTSLPDMSANTELYIFYCGENLLDSIPDLSAKMNLAYFRCENNQLSSLPDLSSNTALISLWCFNNQLTSISGLSDNTVLTTLLCNDNQLTGLDISGCIALEELDLSNMPTLNCVCVWEVPFPPAGVTVNIANSPYVYFDTECVAGISNTFKENRTIKIYPNPNEGIFSITIESMKKRNASLKIYDPQGRLILYEKLKGSKVIFTPQLDLRKYSEGIYFLQILSTDEVVNEKIIIER